MTNSHWKHTHPSQRMGFDLDHDVRLNNFDVFCKLSSDCLIDDDDYYYIVLIILLHSLNKIGQICEPCECWKTLTFTTLWVSRAPCFDSKIQNF